MEAALSCGWPSGRTVRAREAPDAMTTILFVFRWYHLGRAVVHHYVSVFGMLAHWKPKYRYYAISIYLIVSIFYLWLNHRSVPRTIASPSLNLRIHVKVTTCTTNLQRRWTSCYRTQRASHFIFSTFEHFDLTITSGNKVLRLVTVYRPSPSRKSFRVERFFTEFSAFLEELTVTSYQFLLCGDFNFHGVDDNVNVNAKRFHHPRAMTFFFLPIWNGMLTALPTLWDILWILGEDHSCC